jgi:protein-disulfide isomerase
VLSQIQASNPADVRVIFRHYPLDRECNPTLSQQVHPSSCAASVAAECAGEQGKFWEYADLLFADQKQYTRQDLDAYARVVDLDISRFDACLADGRMKSVIDEDVEEAQRIKIKATPTLIINGRLIEGLPSPQKFVTLLAVEKQQAAKK